jgi:2-oxoglutarate ferredoxin oxidoreductase subunit gamma
MAQTQIRIGGFGGQGVILSGIIIGRAAAIHAGLHATLVQSFGPEARGSSSSAELIVSDEPIWYPYVARPRHARGPLAGRLRPVRAGPQTGRAAGDRGRPRARWSPPGPEARHFVVPATRLAEEIGRKIVLNIITVGFFGAVSQLMPHRGAGAGGEGIGAPGTLDLNLRAFRKGWEAGQDALAKAPLAV